MVCLGCSSLARGRLCASCRRSLRKPPLRILPGGLVLVAALEHTGAARRLIHLLKYRGIAPVAEIYGKVLADELPMLPLVPVSRAISRRLNYGIDPAREIAIAVGRLMNVPVLDIFAPALHSRRRAGSDHRVEVLPRRVRSDLPDQLILVDDVATTGSTLVAAARDVGLSRVRMAAVANAVPELSSLPSAVTSPNEGRE